MKLTNQYTWNILIWEVLTLYVLFFCQIIVGTIHLQTLSIHMWWMVVVLVSLGWDYPMGTLSHFAASVCYLSVLQNRAKYVLKLWVKLPIIYPIRMGSKEPRGNHTRTLLHLVIAPDTGGKGDTLCYFSFFLQIIYWLYHSSESLCLNNYSSFSKKL